MIKITTTPFRSGLLDTIHHLGYSLEKRLKSSDFEPYILAGIPYILLNACFSSSYSNVSFE